MARDGFDCACAANDDGCIEKCDAMRKSAQEKTRIHFASALDEQAGDILSAQLFEQPFQIDAAVALGRTPDLHFALQGGNTPIRRCFSDNDRSEMRQIVADHAAYERSPRC